MFALVVQLSTYNSVSSVRWSVVIFASPVGSHFVLVSSWLHFCVGVNNKKLSSFEALATNDSYLLSQSQIN